MGPVQNRIDLIQDLHGVDPACQRFRHLIMNTVKFLQMPAFRHGKNDEAALLEPLLARFPKWWVPDRVVFVDVIPRTSTGKFDKRSLRDRVRREGCGS